jgi:hypothetical protein
MAENPDDDDVELSIVAFADGRSAQHVYVVDDDEGGAPDELDVALLSSGTQSLTISNTPVPTHSMSTV